MAHSFDDSAEPRKRSTLSRPHFTNRGITSLPRRQVSRWLNARPDLRDPVILAAGALLTFLVAAPDIVVPAVGLDAGWQGALNYARPAGLRWGSDLVFTYGPWGYLNSPLATNRAQLLAAILFAVVSSLTCWAALRASLSGLLRPRTAAYVAALIPAAMVPVRVPSMLLFVGVSLFCLQRLIRPGRGWSLPFLIGSTAAAALSTQVKFSEGVVLTGIVVLSLLLVARNIVIGAALAIASYLAVFTILWLIGGQALSDLVPWTVETVGVARHYTDAMALDQPPNVFGYALIALAIIGAAVFVVRSCADWPVRVRVGVSLVTAAVLYLGFREVSGRHGAPKDALFYVYGLGVFALLTVAPRATAVRRIFLVAVVLIGFNGGGFFDTRTTLNRWSVAVQTVVDQNYRRQLLDEAGARVRRSNQLPESVLAAVRRHPVAIDGFSVNIAWAYGLDWSPPPAFQSYVAYSGALDRLNTEWLRDGPSDQRILRPPSTAIDGRNSLWDPPRYVLTEMCTTRPAVATPTWMALERRADVCSSPVQASSVHVAAGQTTAVPAAGADRVVVMSFAPDPPGLVRRAGRLLVKPLHPLQVQADATAYRLPIALANGPLIVHVPRAIGWPTAYGGTVSYRNVAFSNSGTVTFRTIAVRS